MKKNDKIQDSPEFKYLEANFSDFEKEMEEDKESADLKLPDGWEQDFARTIDETLDGNERKRRNKIVKRIVGVAAAAVLVLVLGNFTAERVSGEGLLEMFMNQFTVGEQRHDIYGNENEIEFEQDNDEKYIYFSGTTLEELNKQIREEIKAPMFYLSYLPDGFTIKEASYERVFRVINIILVKEDEYIYIFQQRQVDERTSGTITENSESISIENDFLNKNISVYKGNRDNSWTFHIDENEIIFSVDAFISKEECIKIAENIKYE